MRDLLAKIPVPDREHDRWLGSSLPPEYHELTATSGPAWFVDGGNAAILEAPHFSFQQLRAISIHYPSKRIEKREELALLTKAKEGWILHLERAQPVLLPTLELQDAIGMARQRLELALVQNAIASHDGLVVLDGDLAPPGAIALQKSITTLTENGFPLTSVLDRPGPWYAQLGRVHAVKLHERARHVFLVRGTEANELAILAAHSSDALFPGYPGGLVLADKLARVSKEEAQALRVKARSLLRELRGRVDAAEAAIDSHSILDSMG